MADESSEDGVTGVKDGAKDSANANANAIIIKKYANRRLYNTQSSSYITLDHLGKMTREGVEFRVLDAKTGADITHQILTQIIMDEEAGGEQMLPVNFLRQLIGMYGNSMQSLFPQYLEASMDNFNSNRMKLRKVFEDSIETNPLTRLAQQNMEMFKVAAAAFMPGAERAEDTVPADTGTRAELDEMRAQMAAMQKKLDAITK